MNAFVINVDEVDDLISDRVVDEYWQRGYWRSPQLLSTEKIERLRRAHERLWSGDYDHEIASNYGLPKEPAHPADLRQQCNSFWLNDEIREVVTSPIIGKIGAKLMRVDCARLWHDQAILKPPLAATRPAEGARPNVGWHQDYGYWTCADSVNMCTAWVALQDTDLHNGGMRTITGSHKWGLIADSHQFMSQTLDEDAARFASFATSEWIDEPCTLVAGSASFHHALTFHGSGENRSTLPRLSVVAHMMPDGTGYRSGQLQHPNQVFLGPSARDGQPFDGPYFPVMWPPASTTVRRQG